MATNAVLTPGQAAKQWAAAHPDAAGRLIVRSYTPKGKGGWGLTEKDTTFYVRDGKAVRRRQVYRSYPDPNAFNGICQCCGQVHLDPVLQPCYGPDPEAGQKPERLPLWLDAQESERVVIGAFAFLNACLDCVSGHALRVEYYSPGWTADHQTYIVTRPHPSLARFDVDGKSRLDVIDLRDATLPAVHLAFLGA